MQELDDQARKQVAEVVESTVENGLPPPHLMASYNWTHQDVILRVVVSLQGRGYLVWVDTEQMKGSTVDAMALAVEGADVMLIGLSRQYKESSNCRMEARKLASNPHQESSFSVEESSCSVEESSFSIEESSCSVEESSFSVEEPSY